MTSVLFFFRVKSWIVNCDTNHEGFMCLYWECSATFIFKQGLGLLEHLNKELLEFHHGSAVTNMTSIYEDVGSIPASLSGLRIQCCYELLCRWQVRLRSGIAVAAVQARSCSSNSTLSVGSSICHRYSPKKEKKKKKKKKGQKGVIN